MGVQAADHCRVPLGLLPGDPQQAGQTIPVLLRQEGESRTQQADVLLGEVLSLGQLQQQTLGEVSGPHARRVQGLDGQQGLLQLKEGDAHLLRQLGQGAVQVTGGVQAADEVAAELPQPGLQVWDGAQLPLQILGKALRPFRHRRSLLPARGGIARPELALLEDGNTVLLRAGDIHRHPAEIRLRDLQQGVGEGRLLYRLAEVHRRQLQKGQGLAHGLGQRQLLYLCGLELHIHSALPLSLIPRVLYRVPAVSARRKRPETGRRSISLQIPPGGGGEGGAWDGQQAPHQGVGQADLA